MKSIIFALLFLVGRATSETTPADTTLPPDMVINYWKATVIQKDAQIELLKAVQEFKDATLNKKATLENLIDFCAEQEKALARDKEGNFSCETPPKENKPQGDLWSRRE